MKAHVAALKAVMMRQQEEKKAAYGDVVVSKRQSTQRVQDVEGLRTWIRNAELSRDELLEFVEAAKEFDFQRLPLDRVQENLLRFDTTRPKSPYIIVERARKQAPKTAAA